MSFIETRSLTKIYGTGETAVHALRRVNVSIEKGEFVVVTGASGSGKSTLLHMLGGIDRPTRGKVYIDGIELFASSDSTLAAMRRQMIGFVFQSYNLIPVLTVQENICLPLKMDKQKPDRAYYNELIELLGLGGKQTRLPGQLSGGQQQRVAIARALIAHPAIVLADEPTGNLDSENSAEVLCLLKESVELFEQTLVLITHDGNVAKQADRIIVMRDGQVAEDSSL
ncbi:MAG: peptide ABC transporter ATP-binding protein [Clostridiales bacterium 43-6]|nr:MAG: peptide ABC transporter ATP-binding protein [Clostridiales bacterium 43-6]